MSGSWHSAFCSSFSSCSALRDSFRSRSRQRRSRESSSGAADVVDLLAVERVSKAFGGIQAVDECSIRVDAGSIGGLIGPNGAGKSTLFNLVVGTYPPDEGRIAFSVRGIDGL